jgi:hypothetical protein
MRQIPVGDTYENTQNVQRFLKAQCGEGFQPDRSFMVWIKNGSYKTMGDVADEWARAISIHTNGYCSNTLESSIFILSDDSI